MRIVAILFLIIAMMHVTRTFEIKNPDNLASSVSKTDNLKWNCQTCLNTCAYGGFPSYCADAYYCVCSYQSTCTASVKNICWSIWPYLIYETRLVALSNSLRSVVPRNVLHRSGPASEAPIQPTDLRSEARHQQFHQHAQRKSAVLG